MNATLFLLLLITSLPVCGAAIQYEIVPTPESHFALVVYKTGLMAGKKHQFEFSRYRGVLQYDPEQAAHSSLRLTIESGSVICQDTWVKPKDLDKIQKYTLNDMLDAEHHPEIVFRSTAAKPLGEGLFQVTGQLTIREKAKPAMVEVKADWRNSHHPRFTGQANIKLTDYDLKPPTAALGAIGTKEDMTLVFQLTGKLAQ